MLPWGDLVVLSFCLCLPSSGRTLRLYPLIWCLFLPRRELYYCFGSVLRRLCLGPALSFPHLPSLFISPPPRPPRHPSGFVPTPAVSRPDPSSGLRRPPRLPADATGEARVCVPGGSGSGQIGPDRTRQTSSFGRDTSPAGSGPPSAGDVNYSKNKARRPLPRPDVSGASRRREWASPGPGPDPGPADFPDVSFHRPVSDRCLRQSGTLASPDQDCLLGTPGHRLQTPPPPTPFPDPNRSSVLRTQVYNRDRGWTRLTGTRSRAERETRSQRGKRCTSRLSPSTPSTSSFLVHGTESSVDSESRSTANGTLLHSNHNDL